MAALKSLLKECSMYIKLLFHGLLVASISFILCACASADAHTAIGKSDITSPAVSSEESSAFDSASENAAALPKVSYDAEIAEGFTASVTELGDYELPPIYYGIGFERGIRSMKVNGKSAYVDRNKNVLPFNNIGWFAEPIPFSVVRINGKCGVVNADFEVIVPVEYDQIFRAYQFENNTEPTDSVIYTLKNGEWSAIDIEKRIQIFYTPKAREDAAAALKYFDAMIYDGEIEYIKYHGKQTPYAVELLLPALDRKAFKLYAGSSYIGDYEARMIEGPYGDLILFDFYAGTKRYDLNTEGHATAVIGELEPIPMESIDAQAAIKHLPESQDENLNSALPVQAFELVDTGISLLSFYVTDTENINYHIYAAYTPKDGYREVWRGHLSGNINPESEILFIGRDRNQAYSAIFRESGKMHDYIDVFQFE